jgi:ankyrin repeat protein
MKNTNVSLENNQVLSLIRAIVRDDAPEVAKMLGASPFLARECLAVGATRQGPGGFFFEEIKHYFYAGDTPLHAAAAGYRIGFARELIKQGADVAVRNRRGAQPLHYASDGGHGLPGWNAQAQAEMIAFLIKKGADANALDKSGVAPLHRAVRNRCSRAVDSLLRNGADVRLKNKSGSTPLHLAVQNTGKSGSGSPESKTLQREIIELLLKAGAGPQDHDARGKTVEQSAESEWIRVLL